MADCIFCKLAQGEIPVTPIYEDDDILSFNDLNPVAPFHALVISKKHFETINHLVASGEASLLEKLFTAVSRVTSENKLDSTGYRLIVNSGLDGGQTINHLHVHIIGGTKLGNHLI